MSDYADDIAERICLTHFPITHPQYQSIVIMLAKGVREGYQIALGAKP